MLPFLTPKKLFKVDIFRDLLNNASTIQKNIPNGQKNRPKYVRKMYFCMQCAFFVLSGRFGDSFGRAGDSARIQ